jgi:hypothetical protein|tara:strand:- start:1876 stop:2058 length:183 start_codon:yes stop_codon:yes gene_type:complete
VRKILGIVVLGLLWCTTSYSNIIMQDLAETKKSKSIEVVKDLKSIDSNDKSYDLIIRKAQ